MHTFVVHFFRGILTRLVVPMHPNHPMLTRTLTVHVSLNKCLMELHFPGFNKLKHEKYDVCDDGFGEAAAWLRA